jgi:hypothetical protein
MYEQRRISPLCELRVPAGGRKRAPKNLYQVVDQSATPDEHLMSQAEVAAALGVPPTALSEWHRRAQGPPAVAEGGMLRYRPTDVADWLRDRIRTIDSGSK